MTVYIKLLLLVLLSGLAGCVSSESARGKLNPLPYLWRPFAPERVRGIYEHTILKFYRGQSDCQPFCPKVDVWQYQYQPKNQPRMSDAKPIATKKQHWKIPNEARIMAINLYGNKKEYYDGIIEYLDSFNYIKKKNEISDELWGYETFTVRVYVAKRNPTLRAKLGPLKNETPDAFIQLLLDRGCEIAFVDNHMPEVQKDATFWRFLIAAEPMLENERIRYIVRDADWRLTAGELYAVGEWIASGLAFHRMHLAPICMGPLTASFWGGSHKGNGIMNDMHARIENFPYRFEYGDDELFTRDMIWPYAKYVGSVMTHYYPRGYKTTLANPYIGSCEEPTQQYCKELNAKAHCEDILMPEEIVFPVTELGMRYTLEDLKKWPEWFNMHLKTFRGKRVREALQADWSANK